jgi:3-oxoacyl-[acyl-carrier protein] reductase
MTAPDKTPSALFISGGSTGLGARLVRDSVLAGFDVAFSYYIERTPAEGLLRQARDLNPSCKVAAYNLDVRSSSAVETVADRVLEDFPNLGAVVCNAGITRVGLMFSMSDADWQEVIDTNLSGAFYVCRRFLPHFLSNRFGRFVHISSVAMHGMAGQAAYCASKAGLAGLSNAIAKEYGRKGITSNTLALGLFDGGLTKSDASDRVISFWKDFCPAGRLGDLGEVARVVHFLASRDSGFINGETIHLAGGLNSTP